MGFFFKTAFAEFSGLANLRQAVIEGWQLRQFAYFTRQPKIAVCSSGKPVKMEFVTAGRSKSGDFEDCAILEIALIGHKQDGSDNTTEGYQ